MTTIDCLQYKLTLPTTLVFTFSRIVTYWTSVEYDTYETVQFTLRLPHHRKFLRIKIYQAWGDFPQTHMGHLVQSLSNRVTSNIMVEKNKLFHYLLEKRICSRNSIKTWPFFLYVALFIQIIIFMFWPLRVRGQS